jgi:hypothetical protein
MIMEHEVDICPLDLVVGLVDSAHTEQVSRLSSEEDNSQDRRCKCVITRASGCKHQNPHLSVLSLQVLSSSIQGRA